jgi:hypothetical protein
MIADVRVDLRATARPQPMRFHRVVDAPPAPARQIDCQRGAHRERVLESKPRDEANHFARH